MASSAHLTTAAPLTTMDHPAGQPLTTFHIFPKLPQEIQDRIWALAIDVDEPRGYNCSFTFTKIEGTTTSRWGLRKIRQPDPPFIGLNERTRKIMLARRAAAKVAKLEWNNWKPDIFFKLEDRSNVGDPMSLVKAESDTSPKIVVNAAKDLMVIPNIGRSKVRPGVVQTFLPHHILAHHSDSRLLGNPGKLWFRLMNMLPLCPNIRILYIIIHNFAASQAEPVAEDFGSTAGHLLERYKRELREVEPHSSSTTYPLGDRIYYEIKPEDFPRTEEFVGLLQDFSHVLGWYVGQYKDREQRLAIRFMTWRYA
ncbi:hypothetical protein NCS52_01252800 [Fusarium sp. LHS14.1]|nr:hypothetical protein NCS52_01252800 [Fusarium sp. LHS14.1]